MSAITSSLSVSRVGLDARGIREEPDGIGHATLRLIHGLAIANTELEFVVWHLPEARNWLPNHERIHTVACGHHHLSWHTLHGFGKTVDAANVDVYHAPFFLAPLTCRTPTIVTVHDLLALDDPSFFDDRLWRLKRWFHRRYVPKVLQTARGILCVSDTVSQRVRELVPDEKPIAAVHHGLEPNEWNQPVAADTRHHLDRLQLPERFFLHLGRWRGYKDLNTLFAGYRLYRKSTPRAPVGLVCCRGGGSPQWETLLDSYQIRETVRILDAPSDALVKGLLQRATGLIQSSRYEGFGLPVLEAMAAGTPVIASTGGALPEVVGEAGLLFEVGDRRALAEAMMRLATHPDLCHDSIVKGRERAEQFTIERMARATLDFYNRVYTETKTVSP